MTNTTKLVDNPHFVVDSKNVQIVDCNRAMADLFGRDEEFCVGMSLREIVTGDLRDWTKNDWKMHLEETVKEGGSAISVTISDNYGDQPAKLKLFPVANTGYLSGHIELLSEDTRSLNWDMVNEVFSQMNEHIMIADNRQPQKGPPEVFYVNQAYVEHTGYTLEEMQDKTLEVLNGPKTDQEEVGRLIEALEKEKAVKVRFLSYPKEGDPVWIDLKVDPIRNREGEVTHWLFIGHDITELKEKERKLADLLSEKKTLLKEIHHRIKNNLAIVSGLLELQQFETKDHIAGEALKESQLRIQSMAKVHESLYENPRLSGINLNNYLQKLIDAVQNSYGFDKNKIQLIHEIEDNIELDINQAVPLALLVSELVTNSYKHAFDEGERGEIRVEAYEKKGKIKVRVVDDGRGIEPGQFEKSESLGSEIIYSLTDQLGADLQIKDGNGSCFELQIER